MITYNYYCKNCKNEKTILCSPNGISGVKVPCDKCGAEMYRSWKASLIIPDSMKSSELQEMDWIKERLKNRPSGKRKVFY